jgi:hypothetical protein
MTMTEVDEARAVIKLQRENRELKSEVDALKAQLEGNIPKATDWLQWKVWRQRVALDALNRRVVNQRFVLRTIEELGRGLSREEFLAAKARQPEAIQDRIED